MAFIQQTLKRDNNQDASPMGIPNYQDSVNSPNIRFYKNEIPARPNEERIEEILLNWTRNYTELETNHLYIQWLFPNRVHGLNQQASVLTDEDAKIIRSTPVLRERVRRAFEMMLDFYGMRLTWNDQFELTVNSEERLRELNQWKNHNFLRITRILLALKELGHKDLMRPWMTFLADLIYKEKKLNEAKYSFETFWIDTLDAEDKIQLTNYKNTLLNHRPAGIPSKNILPSTMRDNNTEPSYDKGSDILPKSIDELVPSIPAIALPASTLDKFGFPLYDEISDTTKDTEAMTTANDTTKSQDTIPRSTPDISTGTIPSPIPDIPKDTEAITTAEDITNYQSNIPRSTPDISTGAFPSPMFDTTKDTEAITTANDTTKSQDTIPRSTPDISTGIIPSPIPDTPKDTEAIAEANVSTKANLNMIPLEPSQVTTLFTQNLSTCFDQFC